MGPESFRSTEQKRTPEQEASLFGENLKNLSRKAERKLPGLGERLVQKFKEKEFVLASVLGGLGVAGMGELINKTTLAGQSPEIAGIGAIGWAALVTAIKSMEALLERLQHKA